MYAVIGGTRIVQRSDQGILRPPIGQAYDTFRSIEPDHHFSELVLEAIEAPFNIPPGFTPLCHSGNSWNLFRNANERLLAIDHSNSDKIARWTARFDTRMERVRIEVDRSVGTSAADANLLMYPLDQLLVVMHLATRDGLLVHSAGMVRDGRAFVFPGVCNAGKTTITRLFMEQGAYFISDDRIVLRRIDDGFHAFGTPWPGEAGIAENVHAPISALFFLSQGADNRITRLSPARAVGRLLPVTSIMWQDPVFCEAATATCDTLLRGIPAYDLTFQVGPGVVEEVYRFIDTELGAAAV